MVKKRLVKPDGRALLLYARGPLSGDESAPQPPGPAVRPETQLRWHPLRGEWVAYASHRQERTFLPPEDWDPLAPTQPGREPTELPAGGWEVAVFENRFPALAAASPPPEPGIVEVRPGTGACEVVVYTQSGHGGLADLEPAHLELLLEVWGDRTLELGARPAVRYVMPFENRGAEVGATLHHPHGQIYAYPFVPPVAARELAQQADWLERRGRGLLEEHVAAEESDGRRMLHAGDTAVAFVPAFARYPYEAWVTTRAPVPTLAALDDAQRAGLARALQALVAAYDEVRGAPFPYVMVIHQAPTDGEPHPEAHLHFEFYPAYRTPERLKYLAGTEVGAGMFTNDALPEAKAAELRNALERARARGAPGTRAGVAARP